MKMKNVGDDLKKAVAPALNGNTADMSGTREYWRKTPIRAKQMVMQFTLTIKGRTFLGNAGDWLCEASTGERWIVPGNAFNLMFSPKPPPEDLTP